MGYSEDIVYEKISELVSRINRKIEGVHELITDLENIQLRICEVSEYKINSDDRGLMKKAEYHLR